ncbi:MAG TPA: hypothetical protein VLY24_25140 [Bryobacteraceae bacterium]|nr:hypothetical protein [Bryobacteraceae bacterium]
MKRFFLLLGCGGMLLSGAELEGVHSVYLLPMSKGLDQYLANRLTNEHLFQVVTDPKRADAIFTDRIGESFEERLTDLLPSPEPVSKPTPPPPPSDETADQPRAHVLPTETVNKLSNPATSGGFGRGKGTVFLVDPKTHEVLWSAYQPSKNSSNTEMDRTASDIVSRLKHALKPK